jgi:predicted transcriptional regulator
MKKGQSGDDELLVQIRSLLILDLVKKGVKQAQIASALDMDAATISRMFPKGLLKDVAKGG